MRDVVIGDGVAKHSRQDVKVAKGELRRAAKIITDAANSPAIDRLFSVWAELRNEGWQDMAYAPKDEEIEVIELGSTGIHKAVWFSFGHKDDKLDQCGSWFIDGDFPSDPVLWRRKRDAQE